MIMKVTGSRSAAPSTCVAMRVVDVLAAVAAATIPRGAIQPMKMRSCIENPLPMVMRNTMPGRTTRMSTAITSSVGRMRGFTDDGVTSVLSPTNNTPMPMLTTVSKNGSTGPTSRS